MKAHAIIDEDGYCCEVVDADDCNERMRKLKQWNKDLECPCVLMEIEVEKITEGRETFLRPTLARQSMST